MNVRNNCYQLPENIFNQSIRYALNVLRKEIWKWKKTSSAGHDVMHTDQWPSDQWPYDLSQLTVVNEL